MSRRRASDWLDNSHTTPDERSGADRRASERRAARNRFNHLFAATLVNHIAKPETPCPREYAAPRPRKGIVLNVKA